MEVGQVRVSVPHRLVNVLVGVWLGPFVTAMRVLVMLVADVTVRMHQSLMNVLVCMPLG